MPAERVVITVKTYPQLSTKYGETVCTAGMREDGSWVRLYPIPFRLLDLDTRYKRWEIIETPLRKVSSDPRPESHNPIDPEALEVVGKLETGAEWQARRDLVFKNETVHDELKPLVKAAHENQCSLATFKPSEVLDFGWEACEREWDSKKLEAMRKFESQGQLFAGEDWREGFRVIPKLPYKFRYRFRDANGYESNPQILDWELGALFWNCLRSEASEEAALEKVREKFLHTLTKTDLHFFLGTTQNYHGWATNPWLVVGVFYPPVVNQQELGLNLE